MEKPKHPDFERLIRHYVRLWGPSEVLEIVGREAVDAIRDAEIFVPTSGSVTFQVDELEFSINLRIAILKK